MEKLFDKNNVKNHKTTPYKFNLRINKPLNHKRLVPLNTLVWPNPTNKNGLKNFLLNL
jgi:hypothetical protein